MFPVPDFTETRFVKRVEQANLRLPLARACGLSMDKTVTIIDATAGLGRDGFLLAALGAQVMMIERAPPLAKLLANALLSATSGPEKISNAAQRIKLQSGDAIQLLPSLLAPDVIYIDPMHPKRNKSALVKGSMRALQEMLGPDEDVSDLLSIALERAVLRVVLKWPRKQNLPGIVPKPTFEISGKTTRYVVFQRG